MTLLLITPPPILKYTYIFKGRNNTDKTLGILICHPFSYPCVPAQTRQLFFHLVTFCNSTVLAMDIGLYMDILTGENL